MGISADEDDTLPVRLKLALTDWLVLSVKAQVVAVPEHVPPDHPAKVLPADGVAVSVMLVPLL